MSMIRVEVELPGKQGLKHDIVATPIFNPGVEVELPGKQGLKLLQRRAATLDQSWLK